MWYWVCFKIFCGCSVWVAAVVPQQVVSTRPLSACAFAQIFLVAVGAVGTVQAEAEGVCYVFFILARFVLCLGCVFYFCFMFVFVFCFLFPFCLYTRCFTNTCTKYYWYYYEREEREGTNTASVDETVFVWNFFLFCVWLCFLRFCVKTYWCRYNTSCSNTTTQCLWFC